MALRAAGQSKRGAVFTSKRGQTDGSRRSGRELGDDERRGGAGNMRIFSGARRLRLSLAAAFVLTLALLALVGPFSGGATAADTCTDSWKAAVSGDWNTATNWSTNAVPTSGDDACI